MSMVRYVIYGPGMPSWGFGTQLSRDLLVFIARGTPPGALAWVDFNGAACHYWPRMAQLLQQSSRSQHTRAFAIPACTPSAADVAGAGVWSAKLAAVAEASRGLQLPAECVFPPDSASVADGRRAILYFHGGAYVAGTLDSYRGMHARLARATGLRVYGFEYRLAPGAQYPTQLFDALSALRHMRELGHADEDIVFAGDSAGGNLALALWLLVRPPIAGMVLLSPRVDVTSARASWKTFAAVDIVEPYVLADPDSCIRKLLLPPGAPLTADVERLLADPFLAPVHADLAGLPPTLVQVGTAEVMYDDICVFVANANAQNCTAPDRPCHVELQRFRDMFHVFQYGPVVTPAVARAWDAVGAFVRSLGARSA
ncbi:hypothetical protein IWQ57_004097 [Coemansia nantahalensis]|uniref:Uncharacterized protein n=1 Tax=Coemansia nantahalensis TaxID=2789366 RepID=A0ACC1JTP5_9FUNG|nr:hypothetical protein IWQ57_004097 [Coemansia nantahalensis]